MAETAPFPAALRGLVKPFRNRADSEHEQATIRLIVALLLPVYSWLLERLHKDPVVLPDQPVLILLIAVSSAILLHIGLQPAPSPIRRLTGTVVDISAITYFFFAIHALAIPLFSLYLWTIVGNGFRYGRPYLLFALGLSLTGFGGALLVMPYWADNQFMGWGLWVGMLAVCCYVGQLVDRLHKALRCAEAANQAKRQFISSITHELRTPLNAIIGMADLLQTTELTAEQRDLLHTLYDSSRVMLFLVEDVLDFAKIEAGKLTLERIEVALEPLVRSTAEIFRYQALNKGLALAARVDPAVPPCIIGDEHYLRQVLVNLLSNAVKFTDVGCIELIVSRAPDGRTEEGERIPRIRFEVVDTGIGMSEETQARIFDSFTQADESTTRRYGGTGLGTTIARQLVELMDGRIGVKSAPGKGSTFWFELPAGTQARVTDPAMSRVAQQDGRAEAGPALAPRPTSAPIAPYRPARAFHVLVAEDNPTNRKVMQKILDQAGHSYVMAVNGEEALDRLSREEFDVVLLDMNMPLVGGLEVAKTYRFLVPEQCRAPVIMFTASVTTEAREECLQAGVDAYLPKPVEVRSLLTKLDEVVQHKSPVPKRTYASAPAQYAPQRDSRDLRDPVIDADVLADLETLGNDDQFVDLLLAGFMEDNGKLLQRMEVALPLGLHAECRDILHAIKGSAVSLGAKSMRSVCERIESLSGEEMVCGSQSILRECRQEFAELCMALNGYRKQRKSRPRSPDHTAL
ncbi:MAG: histidine kinase [Paucimonas sp.]|nr:histidine kinase [Paucimonas sp.]